MVGHAAYSSSLTYQRTKYSERPNRREPIPTIEMSKEKIKETVEKFGGRRRMKRVAWTLLWFRGHGN
jgi:hypothetical protein